jgi:hypothetical protein
VIPLLQNSGLCVTAVQIPLTSLADDVAATRHVIELQKGSTILAGHSYGGSVITEAEPMRTPPAGVRFGVCPEEGESLGDLARSRAGCGARPSG